MHFVATNRENSATKIEKLSVLIALITTFVA